MMGQLALAAVYTFPSYYKYVICQCRERERERERKKEREMGEGVTSWESEM